MAVCCALSLNQVIGLYYFDHPIVTGERDVSLLNKVTLKCSPAYLQMQYFQQEEASPHYSISVRLLADAKFPGL